MANTFKVGKIYRAWDSGDKIDRLYLCVERRPSGFIWFRDITDGMNSRKADHTIRRKVIWTPNIGETVEIDKGGTTCIRGCKSGTIHCWAGSEEN